MRKVKFKNLEGDIIEVSVESLIDKKVMCNISASGKVCFLTPKILSTIHEDQELTDWYNSKKTKKQFLADRDGSLAPSEKGGATIFGLEIFED